MADKTIGDLTAASSVAAGDLFEIENTAGNSRKVTAAQVAAFNLGAIHCYEEAAGAGGGSTASTWVTRNLTTAASNSITGASLASNEITLPAGTYEIIGSAPAFGAQANKVRLYDVTGAASVVEGETVWGNNTTMERRVGIRGRFTLAVQSNVRIEMYSSASVATNGFGVDAGFVGVDNHFTDVLIRRVA